MFAAPASYAKRRVRGKSQKERGASFERRLEVELAEAFTRNALRSRVSHPVTSRERGHEDTSGNLLDFYLCPSTLLYQLYHFSKLVIFHLLYYHSHNFTLLL